MLGFMLINVNLSGSGTGSDTMFHKILSIIFDNVIWSDKKHSELLTI